MFANILPGVGISHAVSSGPVHYQMKYLNGTFAYDDPFAYIMMDRNFVAAAGAQLGAAVHAAATALNGVPLVGAALGGLLELATSWYAAASLDPDGSVTIMFAYHYVGTKAGGVDLTAKPLPGVDQRAWRSGVVDNLLRFRPPLAPPRQGIEQLPTPADPKAYTERFEMGERQP